MKLTKEITRVVTVASTLSLVTASAENSTAPTSKSKASSAILHVNIPMNKIPTSHPRLFVGNVGFDPMKQQLQTPTGQALAERIMYDANLILGYAPQPRVMNGRRMLMASRNVLYRINTLAVAYHLSGEKQYADRAVQEMLNVASFTSWNPAHFLDVGEMTLAMAIGYDWLYDQMSNEQRSTIANAIINLGLKPSFATKGNWWIKSVNNWYAVCHAGMIAGAIAVADLEPELAQKTIKRAVENATPYFKASYYPNGAYPEGPIYWTYGTEFTSVLLALLDNAFGTDFGLSELPGFSATGDYWAQVTTPSNMLFNYADSSCRTSISFATIWLAHRFDRPDWLKNDEDRLDRILKSRPDTVEKGGNRLLPLALLYLNMTDQYVPTPLYYTSGEEATVPITIHRSDRSSRAAWVGLKGGSPASNHGHMDGGSFIFETNGYRWAQDLGPEDYTKIEAQKLNLWDKSQFSDRWNILRIGPESHNILRINQQQQNVKGRGCIIKFSPNSSTMDLSSLYTPEAQRVIRSATLLPDRALEIHDQITGLKSHAKVTWQMCTSAETETTNDKILILHYKNKSLQLRTNHDTTWDVIPEAKLRMPYDTPNPNVKMVSFTIEAPRDGKLDLVVTLTPLP